MFGEAGGYHPSNDVEAGQMVKCPDLPRSSYNPEYISCFSIRIVNLKIGEKNYLVKS